jgi:hypothetical protein
MSSYPQCLKYQAAYRVAFVATVFFASMTALTAAQPAFHNQVRCKQISSPQHHHERGDVQGRERVDRHFRLKRFLFVCGYLHLGLHYGNNIHNDI